MLFWTIFKEYCGNYWDFLKDISIILSIFTAFIGLCPINQSLKIILFITIYGSFCGSTLIYLLILSIIEIKVFKSETLIQKRWRVIIFWDDKGVINRRTEMSIFNNGQENIPAKTIREYFEEALFPKDFTLSYKLIDPRHNGTLIKKLFRIKNGIDMNNDSDLIIGIDKIQNKIFKFIRINLPINIPMKEERKYIYSFTNTHPTLPLDEENEYCLIVTFPTIEIDVYLITPHNYEFVEKDIDLEVFSDEDCTVRNYKEEGV